jgi:hypothetical protein
MPRGGAREGAGRKPGSLQKRHKVVVEDPSELMPVQWMLAVLRDPECEQSRRDQMAIQAASYLHPRLNAVATSHVNGNGPSGDINIVQIVAVPRGALVDAKTGMITTIDGAAVTDLPELRPFDPTPPLELTAITDQMQPAPLAERLEVIEPGSEQEKVASLNAYRRSREEPPDTA